MVEDKTHVGTVAGHPQRGGQLRRADQQIVGQASVADGPYPAPYVTPVEPAGIRFVLDQVAQADKAAAAGQPPQPAYLVSHAGGGQVGPADHACDHPWRGRQGQEFLGLRRTGQYLDQHAGRYPVVRGDQGEVGRTEPAAQSGQRVEPGVRPGTGIPYVVVRVNDHVPERHAAPSGNENSLIDSGRSSADVPGVVGVTYRPWCTRAGAVKCSCRWSIHSICRPSVVPDRAT